MLKKYRIFFFEKYKSLTFELRDSLEELKKNDKNINKEFSNKDIKTLDFAKKLMGQIIFIYFIQKKGWIGIKKSENGDYPIWGEGPKDFFKRLYKKEYCDYENFYNDVLEYLFYEDLSSEKAESISRRLNCKIPFLNGGLFEPLNNHNWKETNIAIKNDIFERIIETFNQFNFTIQEEDPLDVDIAIDPEMLGRVLENLLDENIKKSQGVFYTHRKVVNFMCDYSLKKFLQNKVSKLFSDSEINSLITYQEDFEKTEFKKDKLKELASVVDSELEEIKICDPAVGSGAFPVILMKKITNIRVLLSKIMNKEISEYDLKYNFIKNSLHAVDINASAIEVTKLRLWLSLIIDIDDFKKVKPLPNLQYRVIQGDSLIEKLDNIEIKDSKFLKKNDQLNLATNYSTLDSYFSELTVLQNKYYNVVSENKKKELKVKVSQKLVDIFLELVKQQNLKKSPNVEEKFRKCVQENIYETFFPWKLLFANTFKEKNGFDIIIGNPPYLESRDKEFLTSKKDSYIANVEDRFGNGIVSRGSDLLVYFFPLAIDLINDYGVNCYITQNSWLNSEYGKKLQNFLNKTCKKIEIIDSNSRFFSNSKGPNINAVISVIDNYPKKKSTNEKLIYHLIEDRFSYQNFLNNKPKFSSDLSSRFDNDNKWGVLFDSDEWLINIFKKFHTIESHPYKIGQGLNISNQYKIDKESVIESKLNKKILIPFVSKNYSYTTNYFDKYIVDKNKLNNDNDAINFLKENNKEAYDCESRRETIPKLILPRGIGNKFFCSINENKSFSDSYVEIYYSDNCKDIKTLNFWIFLNSTIFSLFREIAGRKNLGGGLLKSEASDLKKINLYYNFANSHEIKEIYDEMKNKEVKDVFLNSQEEFQKKIDFIVLKHFNEEKNLSKISEFFLEKVRRRELKSKT